MKCTDPFSLLYQEQRIKKQVVQQEKSAQIYFKIDEILFIFAYLSSL